MKATVNVSLRIPNPQASLMKRAAKGRGLKLATWIREAAALMAETNPELRREYSAITPTLERAP